MRFETIICPFCLKKLEVNLSNNQTVISIRQSHSASNPLYYRSDDEKGEGIIKCDKCNVKLFYITKKLN